MHKALIALTVTLGIAGCAMSPLQVITKGTHFVGRSGHAAHQAANCIVSMAERDSRFMQGAVRDQGPYVEVIVRNVFDTPSTLSVWHIKAAPEGGSTWQAWETPDLIGKTGSHVQPLGARC